MVAELPFPSLRSVSLGPRRLPVLTDVALFSACGVRVAFTSREGGVSEESFASLNLALGIGDDPGAVSCNRERACEALGVDAGSLVVLSQVHGTRIVNLRDADPGRVQRAREEAREGADGIVVSAPGIFAMLMSADCLGLVIVSPTGRVALAHAGWRGAAGHIAQLAAEALIAADGADGAAGSHSFNAYVGPHIGAECFEVGEDVENLFSAEFGPCAIAGPRHVSLEGAVVSDLCAAGLDERRIVSAGICTKCHSGRYFSYRASGGACGRQAAFAGRLVQDGQCGPFDL